jgi:4a-hydroxytetrahydrobiopterin dehydratase
MTNLAKKKCVPCRLGGKSLAEAEVEKYLKELSGWSLLVHDKIPRIQKVFRFKDFSAALVFANRLGTLADKEDHHPTILVEYGKATVTWWTHIIKGLHLNDFIMAARTDHLFELSE